MYHYLTKAFTAGNTYVVIKSVDDNILCLVTIAMITLAALDIQNSGIALCQNFSNEWQSYFLYDLLTHLSD